MEEIQNQLRNQLIETQSHLNIQIKLLNQEKMKSNLINNVKIKYFNKFLLFFLIKKKDELLKLTEERATKGN